MTVTVRECCTTKLDYASQDTNILDLAKRMREDDIGAIPVAEGGKLIGMITDRDIVMRCVAESKDPESMTARDCMSQGILYCYDDESTEDVLKNMAENAVRRMPVVTRDKNLVGIVSFGDLAMNCDNKELVGETMEEIREAA